MWLRLFALFCIATIAIECVQAATLIVTNTADSGAGSLRQALADADNGDTIQFDAALNGQTITLTSDELVIDRDITISGPSPTLLAVAKTPSLPPYFRIFHVMPSRTVTIEGLTISNGNASGSAGGGVVNEATLTMNNCVVSGNVSDGGVGGGGIYNSGTLTIINSVISDNWAGFTFGFPIGNGGGIYSGGVLMIIRSVITNNTAVFNGGGIMGGAMITLIDSTTSGNRAGSNFSGSGVGGGIYYIGAGEGMLTIENSTISGNTASGNGSGIGGGIVSGGTLTITNSTLSGNFANQDGGAILNDAPLIIANSTISDNRASRNGGGIYNSNVATLEIGDTILRAGATGANIFNNGGTVTSFGYNLSSDNGGDFLTAAGDQINTSPMLGPLQNNGGPTFTHALLPGSPAINAGDPNFKPPPSTDQRGYPRIFNGRIDIGSLEVQPTPTPTPTPSPCPFCGTLVTLIEKFDGVTPPTLPQDWLATNAQGPAPLWVTSNSGVPSPPAESLPNAAFVDDPAVVSDKLLNSFHFTDFKGAGFKLTFRHNVNLEASEKDPNLGFDGGVLEISYDQGQTYHDVLQVGGSFDTGGYNRTISTDRGSPIAGRQAWSGNSGGFMTTTVNLGLPPNVETRLRWRMASDNSGAGQGWRIDNVNITWCRIGNPCSPTPTPPPTPTPTPSVTPTPSATPTPTPTLTPSSSPTPTTGDRRRMPAASRLIFSRAMIAKRSF